MCRFPVICGRHMECACYFVSKVSAVGLTPSGTDFRKSQAHSTRRFPMICGRWGPDGGDL